MKNRLTNSTAGAIQNIASTVQLKQTHILIQSSSRLGIKTGTCLHSQNSRHHMDAIVWQHLFLTSGQLELDFWNSIQKNIITILVHILQLSAIPEYGSQQLHTGYGQPYLVCPCTYESFGKEFP